MRMHKRDSYLNFLYLKMEDCYTTLLALYEAVKHDREPHTYLCTPQEIILHQNLDWELITKNLSLLVAQQLVIIKQLDKLVISITIGGIARVRALQNNFVTSNFSLGDPGAKHTLQS